MGVDRTWSADRIWRSFMEAVVLPEVKEGDECMVEEIRTVFYSGMWALLQWFKDVSESETDDEGVEHLARMEIEIENWVELDVQRRLTEQEDD